MLGISIMLSGCISSHAPKGWLPDANEVAVETKGAWIEIESAALVIDKRTNPKRPRASKYPQLMGELIAIDGDSVYVFAASGLMVLATDRIDAARLFYYDPHLGELETWVFGGFLSTLSHGWYFPLTAIGWISVGSTLVGKRSKEPLVRYKAAPDHLITRSAWGELAEYARFPQGMPKGVEVKR